MSFSVLWILIVLGVIIVAGVIFFIARTSRHRGASQPSATREVAEEPVSPVSSTEPASPVSSTEPVSPVSSSEPASPVSPSEPASPVIPRDSEGIIAEPETTEPSPAETSKPAPKKSPVAQPKPTSKPPQAPKPASKPSAAPKPPTPDKPAGKPGPAEKPATKPGSSHVIEREEPKPDSAAAAPQESEEIVDEPASSPVSSSEPASPVIPRDSEGIIAEPIPEQSAEPEQTPSPADTPEPTKSRWSRLRARLAGGGSFGGALLTIISRDTLTDDDWDELEETLLLADVGAAATEDILDALRTRLKVDGKATAESAKAALRDELVKAVTIDASRDLLIDGPTSDDGTANPGVVLVVGVNGGGKTTSIGRLARLLVADNKNVILGAADTFRAAAAEQLQTWGERVGVDVIRGAEGADPASVAFDAVGAGVERKADVVVIDTAGRLQNKSNLMDELGKIKRVASKQTPITEVLLVLDATTGQNGLVQGRVFAEAVDVTGIVLTKLDGSAKGGIVIAVQRELGVPVKLVGLGEGPDDMAPFDPEQFIDGLLS